MKSLLSLLIAIVTLVCLSLTPAPDKMDYAATDVNGNKELYDTIARMDSILFDAFNNCRYDIFNDLFTKDLEFYHDKGGLTDYDYTVKSLKTKCTLPYKVLRTLVPGSLEVYPVPGYGAIQAGEHEFYNEKESSRGTFKFVHIWKRDKDNWKISRVASYDH